MKDNLISMITPLNIESECFDAQTIFYEKKTPSQKRDLNNKIHNMRMDKDEYVNYLFTNFSQVGDIQLLRIGVVVDDDDLIQPIIDGIP